MKKDKRRERKGTREIRGANRKMLVEQDTSMENKIKQRRVEESS